MKDRMAPPTEAQRGAPSLVDLSWNSIWYGVIRDGHIIMRPHDVTFLWPRAARLPVYSPAMHQLLDRQCAPEALAALDESLEDEFGFRIADIVPATLVWSSQSTTKASPSE